MKKKLLYSASAGLFASAAFLSAQVTYSNAGFLYSEDFDGLNPAFQGGAPHDWIDNTTIPGWYATENNYIANANFTVTSQMYNMRTGSTATNQSLGSLPGAASGTISAGVRLINETGATLTSFELSYIGAQWRNSGNEIASQITVAWSLNPGGLTSGTWNPIGDATFSALHTGGPVGNLNGTLAENRELISVTVDSGFSWEPGQELWIRWAHMNHGGENHALSIDDVSFAAIPEPGHLGALLAGFAGLFLLAVRRRRGR